MKLIVLKEGNYAVNKNKEFTLMNNADDFSGIKIAIQPFLIITANDYILLDTGLRYSNNGESIISQCLKKENIQPEQITKVLLSHLHMDHIGGIGYFEGDNFIGNFPNAKIYLQQREFDFALTQTKSHSYDFEVLNRIKSLPNLVMMPDDKGSINNEISYEVSGGHTPFHQEFWIKENNETIFYGADNLPQSSYLESHLAFKNDYDGKAALSLRQKWIEEAKNNNWTVLFYHDMQTPFLDIINY